MQYILTKKEYESLINQIDHAKAKNSLLIQSLCTQVATYKPIKFWDREEAMPWGCILNENHGMGYCDKCPVQEVCPKTRKEWSK